MEPRYLKEGANKMWLSLETLKSLPWGHEEYFSLRVVSFWVALGLVVLVGLVIWVGFKGVGVVVRSEFL